MNSAETDKFAALTAKRLDELRKELVSIGLRGNPLVNLRPNSRLALELFGTNPDDIFERIVGNEGQVRIRPRPISEDEDATPPLLSGAEPIEPHDWKEEIVVGGDLLADADGETMVARLNKIRREARLNREELGFDVLFLALGLLSYRESASSEKSRLAPLILVPVTLTQTPAGRYHYLSFNGEDIGPNIALSERLKETFGVSLPDVDENVTPSEVFRNVASRFEDIDGCEVLADRTYLGLFSSAYTHMHRDLDEDVWPPELKPSRNEVLQGILAGREFSFDSYEFADWAIGVKGVDLPGYLEPTVLDADASQLDAIHKVESGQNLVIQGPPGTGKSQTITNIIAHAVKEGKTVLFVAEKMAALEVVKRRLDEIQLGHLALELHGVKSRKRDVLDQLRASNAEELKADEPSRSEILELDRAEIRLTAYSKAVNSDLPIVGESLIRAAARLEAMQGRSVPRIELQGIDQIEDEQFADELQRVRDFTDHVELMRQVLGDFSNHPFAQVRRSSLARNTYESAVEALRSAQALIEKIGNTATSISTALGLERANDFATLRSQIPLARRALKTPALGGISPDTSCWKNSVDQLREATQIGRETVRVTKKFGGQIRPKTWERDLSWHLQIWRRRGRNPFRNFYSDFRKSRDDLRRWFHESATDNFDRCLALIGAVNARQKLDTRFKVLEPVAASAFASNWQGLESDFDQLEMLIEWVSALRADVESGSLPAVALGWLTAGSSLPFDASDLDQLAEDIEAAKKHIAVYSDNVSKRLLEVSDSSPIWSGDGRLVSKIAELDRLEYVDLLRFMDYTKLTRALKRSAFGEALDFIREHGDDFDLVRDALSMCRLETIVRKAREDRAEIRDFSPATHERSRQQFASIDKTLSATARANARKRNKNFGSYPAQERLLRREFEKKRRHLATRELIGLAKDAVQARKPVFMMSPASVAKFLRPGVAKFDLVVFDEASQMRAADAIGAILRGDQVVVVGDDQQLPPSDFFINRLQGDDDDDYDVDDLDDGTKATGIESILGLFKIAETPAAHLSWHYRSRREDLIDFSNRNFYDGGLVTFPGPFHGRPERGVQFHLNTKNAYVPRQRKNIGEARQVAERVIQHAENDDDLSLGVAAFSVAQRDAIQDELDRMLLHRRDLDDFFNPGQAVPFFIKNLENVQGDERDVILISVGYGRTQDGRMRMNFGPVNRDGGERRLNVLVTRAKHRMEVFANFNADAIRTTPTSGLGLVKLKEFLDYAENGTLEVPVETGRPPDSEFEEQVAQAVLALGYDAVAQVGVSNYRIDVGVRSKSAPGRYMLGIECDGAMYHSARSARERDRLRQQVLEDMGWRIHRIWSTDWFRSSPEERSDKLGEVLEDAQEHFDATWSTGEGRAKPSRDGASSSHAQFSDGYVESESADSGGAETSRRGPSFDSGADDHASMRASTSEKANRNTSNGAGASGRETRQSAPSIDTSPYQFANLRSFGAGFDGGSSHNRPQLAEAVVRVAEVEAPIHVEVAAQRIADAIGVERTKRFIQDCQEAARRSIRLQLAGSFIHDMAKPRITPRNFSSVPARYRDIKYVAPEEIAAAMKSVTENVTTDGADHAIRLTVAALGFQDNPHNVATARDALESIAAD